jgi:hypothetical protein
VAAHEAAGIPTTWLETEDGYRPWWWDTGAQLSYFQSAIWARPDKRLDDVEDFFPLYGRFTTRTYQLDLALNGTSETIRAGQLPSPLRGLLGSRTAGILGQELFHHRQIGMFPLQQTLMLGPREAAAAECAA